MAKNDKKKIIRIKKSPAKDKEKKKETKIKIKIKPAKTKEPVVVEKPSAVIPNKSPNAISLSHKPIKPIFWILQNQKAFPAWINKTFIKYKITSKTTPQEKGKFRPFQYQQFLRDYMQDASPNRGILLYHGLGSGKTCSAITISENLKLTKNIVVILPASLKSNFIEDGLKFCGAEEYRSSNKTIGDVAIREKYTFISSNASNTIQQLNNIVLDNHVIIIDEVHNLVSRMVGGLKGENKQGVAIYNKLMSARDCKIIALTGTPIVNQPYEIAVLLNVLRGYMYITYFRILYVSPKYGAQWELEQLDNSLKEIPGIDFIYVNRGNKTLEISTEIKPWHPEYQQMIQDVIARAKDLEVNLEFLTYKQFTLFPDEANGEGELAFTKYFVDSTSDPAGEHLKNVEVFKRRAMGLISYYKSKTENFPKIAKNELREVVMSPYQFQEYEKVRAEEKKSQKLAEIRIFSRQYCNFVFPPNIRRPGIGERAGATNKEKNERAAEIMIASERKEQEDEVKREELRKYQRAIEVALAELSAGNYLKRDEGLPTLSPKMLEMFGEIDASVGLVFVYSDFRSLEGVEIFSRILSANGYEKWSATTATTKNNKTPTKRYALYTGSEDFQERNEMIRIFNHPDNRYGKSIKIILATSAGAEGLDLKNVRQVHIMEPYWNEVRIQQVIGRAVRRNSHRYLPEDERNVSIFRYISVIGEAEKARLKIKDRISTDEVLMDIAIRKQKLTNETLGVLKETAVDCVLNAVDNEGGIHCFGFGEGIEGIAYHPRLTTDLGSGVEAETREIERELRHGGIDIEGRVYFIENGRLYLATDVLRRKSIDKAKVPKMKRKVAVDIDGREVFDHDSAIRSRVKVKLGVFDDNGLFSREK